jgi:hypothetical protein
MRRGSIHRTPFSARERLCEWRPVTLIISKPVPTRPPLTGVETEARGDARVGWAAAAVAPRSLMDCFDDPLPWSIPRVDLDDPRL